MNRLFTATCMLALLLGAWVAPRTAAQEIELKPGARIVLMGNGLGSRMLHFGHFETELHLRYPNHKLFIRNICDEGNTPSFRPHSGRKGQLGFPGAEKFFGPYADNNEAQAVGHFETDEQWLARLKPDIIIAFWGFNESFQGASGLSNYQKELTAFINHTVKQKYNGSKAPELILVSPTAYEDRSAEMDVPNGKQQNQTLAAYTSVMQGISEEQWVPLVDAFTPSLKWYRQSKEPLTADGALLNDAGYKKLATLLVDQIFGKSPVKAVASADKVKAAVKEKNWFWINDFKIPNGVHVFGRRYRPFGPANYPFEIEKIREMATIRDQAIWATAQGRTIDIAALDAKTAKLPEVKTNFNPGNKKNGALTFLKGSEALKTIQAPSGYRVELFASEQEFPALANPVQIAFDNKGRLWVATMPSYPHWKPGDPRPNDKLLILEDTNGDGKADKQTVWADNLHLPMGFEISHDGVYVSQGIHLVRLKDTDGDDKADSKEIIFSGFDDHDTHHAIGAYTADPSGAIYMCEGVFLRTNVETPYGPVRGTNGGFFRFSPQRRHLERHAQLSIPNPWGVAFDDWGQHFFLHTSGTRSEWMLPGSVKPRYGVASPSSKDIIDPAHRVRPTSGLEFMVSRHFPDEVQGDMMLCNAIGFRGIKQHQMLDDGAGYGTKWRHDLMVSSDGNFRPVDLEIAPDGSLYVVDWHNPLIGHMQHNARDPHRDHAHGRIYRVTYPSRPLVKPAKVAGASIEQLLDNLKLHEYRTRYRSRRELRARDTKQVLAAVKRWVAGLDKSHANYEHQKLEALWVTWGMNAIDPALLRDLLQAKDFRARAAAVRVLRYGGHQIDDKVALLTKMAADPHDRVKMEVIAAASWLKAHNGLPVLDAVMESKTNTPKKPDEPKGGNGVEISPGGKTVKVTVPKQAQQKTTEVRITVPGRNATINLAEMIISSGGKDVTKTATLTMSKPYNNNQFPMKLLVDGDRSNFMHTAMHRNPWIKAVFSKPTAMDQIMIWTRPDFAARFNDAKIEFYAGKKKLATVNVGKVAGGGGGNDAGKLGDWLSKPYQAADAVLKNRSFVETIKVEVPKHLPASAKAMYLKGAEIFRRDGHCMTCHQEDGKGLASAHFPPLADSKWVTQDQTRLIKITLHGLQGPIEVKGKKYPGLVPMTPFAGMLNDDDIAAVLTYVRNSFGNKASIVKPETVKRVREETKNQEGFYNPIDLLKAHPHQ